MNLPVDHVQPVASMDLQEHHLEPRVILGEIGVEHRTHGEVRGTGIVAIDRWQFEDLRARKEAGRVAVQRPDQIHHAVPCLAHQFRRLAAERHGGIDLDLDPPAGIRLDPLHPGRDDLGMRGRQFRKEMVQLELVFLGGGAARQIQPDGERGRAREHSEHRSDPPLPRGPDRRA